MYKWNAFDNAINEFMGKEANMKSLPREDSGGREREEGRSTRRSVFFNWPIEDQNNFLNFLRIPKVIFTHTQSHTHTYTNNHTHTHQTFSHTHTSVWIIPGLMLLFILAIFVSTYFIY